MFRELKFGGAGSTRLKMPESDFDKAATAVLIGLACIIGSLFLPLHDFGLSLSGKNASGQLVKTQTLSQKGNRESVGIYEFNDDLGSKIRVTSKYAFKDKNLIPKTAEIAWKRGEPQNARVLFQGGFSIWALLIGCGLAGFGAFQLIMLRKKGKSN